MANAKEKFHPTAAIQRIISLGGGTWAYIVDVHGKLHHVERDSAEFYALVNHLNDEMNGIGDRELERLGWA